MNLVLYIPEDGSEILMHVYNDMYFILTYMSIESLWIYIQGVPKKPLKLLKMIYC